MVKARLKCEWSGSIKWVTSSMYHRSRHPPDVTQSSPESENACVEVLDAERGKVEDF